MEYTPGYYQIVASSSQMVEQNQITKEGNVNKLRDLCIDCDNNMTYECINIRYQQPITECNSYKKRIN